MSDIIYFMAQANGKLGDIGWELKAEHSAIDSSNVYDYFIVNSFLIDNSQYPAKYLHPVMWSLNNSTVQDLTWFIDETALVTHPNVVKIQPRGTYDSSVLTVFSNAMFHSFVKRTPETDREFMPEMSCLIWLNNMNYNPIFSLMVRAGEPSLRKYINIMASIKHEYTLLEDYAKTATEYYLLPDEYFQALFNAKDTAAQS